MLALWPGIIALGLLLGGLSAWLIYLFLTALMFAVGWLLTLTGAIAIVILTVDKAFDIGRKLWTLLRGTKSQPDKAIS